MTVDRSRRLWQRTVKPLRNRANFIRAACVLEATAPKAGNVHPSASFDDLNFQHFVTAANCTAMALRNINNIEQLGPSMRSAVEATKQATGTNVNLGIVLLLGPLVASEAVDAKAWRSTLSQLLNRLTPLHGGWIAQAIASASPGGMGSQNVKDTDVLNVNRVDADTQQPLPYDLMKAMRQSSTRDQIARQYATDFDDVFQVVVPTLFSAVKETDNLMSGIVLAQVRLIARWGDSLITRKCGVAQSDAVREMAQDCLREYTPASINKFDSHLRHDGNRLNPGTTADLLAAGLYVCLRKFAT